MTTKISAMTNGVTANGTDKIEIERSGLTKYITPAYIAAYASSVYGLLAQAHTSTDGTYTVSSTRINFDTEDYDPASLVTPGGSWIFTAPATGLYRFEISEWGFNANGNNWAAGNTVKLYLYKSTATYVATLLQYVFGVAITEANFGDLYMSSFCHASLTAADTCHVKLVNATGNSRLLFANAKLSIYRLT